MSSLEFDYSEKYTDDHYEFRHVIIPKEMTPQLPKGRLMKEREWRALGVAQSRGWVHYMIHQPERQVLLFRRPLGTNSRTGKAPPGWTPRKNEELTETEKAMWL